MDLPLDIRLLDVNTRRGSRRVMVATPTTPIVLGRAALSSMASDPDAPSAIDQELIRRVHASPEAVRAFVFNAGPASAHWGFDPSLSPDERASLAYHVVRSQLPLYRGLVLGGAAVHFGAGVGEHEAAALRPATLRVIDELTRDGATDGRDPELDLWVLRHLTFFTTASLQRVLNGTLADKLPLCESRAQRWW